MTFGSTFGRVFSPTFQPKSTGGAVTPWWLSGGIASANCVAAYQPKGAASYAASKVNLANPGTYDAVDGTGYPTWEAASGWTFGAGKALRNGLTPNAKTWTYIVRANIVNAGAGGFGRLFQSSASLYMYPNGGSQRQYWNGGYINITADLLGSHVVCIANLDVYEDGSDVGDIGLNDLSAGEIYIGNRSDYARPFGGSILVFAIYNTTLTSTQIGLLTTAMNAL